MSILTRPASNVNRTRRPFGLGILPDAAPVKVRDLGSPAPEPAWVSAVRCYLKAYTATDVSAAIAWIESRRMIDGCPVVSPADWPAVNALLKANAVPTARVLEVEAIIAADAPAGPT